MKVKIYRELNKPNAKNEASIIFRCRVDGKKQSYSTSIIIPVKDWNKQKKIVRQSNENATTYNELLRSYESEIIDVVNKAEIHEAIPTKEYVSSKLSFTSSNEKAQNLTDYFNEFIEIKKVSVSNGTIMKYKRMFNALKTVAEASNVPFTFNSFNDLFFSKLITYYIEKLNLTNTSAKDYQKKLTSFLNWCTDVGYNSNTRYKKVKIKIVEPDIFPLNDSEIKRLEEIDLPEYDIKDRTRDVFLFQTYTGMRFAEALMVKKSHIHDDIIRFQSKKVNGTKYFIPLTKKAKAIIEKYKNRNDLTEGFLLPRSNNQVVNRYLKEIAEDAGLDRQIAITRTKGQKREEKKMKLYEQISSHDARRTFITFCLSKGMNAQMIMKITGHKDYSSFDRYINFDDQALSKSLNFVWDD